MPIDARIPLQVQGIDPNGFTNALAAGMKMRELQNAGDRLARKDDQATAKNNALSAYGSSNRTKEDLSALWAASPEAAAGVEKTAGQAAYNTARADKAKLEAALQKVELGSQMLSGVHDEPTYQAAKAQAAEAGLDLSQAPQHYFPDWVQQRQQQGLKAKDQIGLQLQALNVNSQIEERGARTGIAQAHLGIAQGNAAETARHHGAMENKTSNGLSITGYDEQGRPLIQMGGTPMGKPAQGKLEEKHIEATDALARLNEIERVSDPKLLTYGNTVKDAALGVKSNLGFALSPDQKEFHNQATDMRQSTMENLSRTIKDLTGSAMQLSEVPRIEATIPTMHDDPDQFPRKLKNSTRLIRNAVIRSEVARQAGMDPLHSGIDLADTKKLMNLREQQLRGQYGKRAPGMAPAETDAAIEKQLREEFGY